jgi:iron complex outermembrane receptor protein
MFAACWSGAARSEAADMAAPPPSAVPAEGALEEITVTAQKRRENMMTVPIAVTSLSGEALQAAGVENTGQLQYVVPGLVYNEFNGFPLYYIRGVGTDFTQPGVNPAVGIYIDGIYQPFSSSQSQTLLDVDRVEVLKGPQGTLYGRNTTAGAININTRAPSTDKTVAEIQAGGGNYAERSVSGYFSTPITDQLAISFAGQYERRNAFDVNGYEPSPISDRIAAGLRGKVVYDCGAAKAELAAWYFKLDDAESAAFQQLQPDSTGAVFGPLIGGGRQSNRASLVYNDFPDFFKNQERGASLKVTVPFAAFDLVSITGFQSLSTTSGLDFDGTDAPIAFFESPQPTKEFTQELQVISKDAGPLQWVAGLYYIDSKAGFDDLIVPAGTTPPLDVNSPTEQIASNSESRAPAIYGQASYKFGPSDAWRATLGGRYSREKIDLKASTVSVTGLGQVAAFPAASVTSSDFSPKATIDYTQGSSLTYFTVARGFKAGAYNLASPGDLTPVEPEKLLSYELGYKLTFLDGRARFETAAYDYNYTDLQVQSITSQSAPLSIGNAKKAVARGLEVSLVAQPAAGLVLTSALAWEPTAKYSEYGQTQADGTVVGGGVAYNDNGAGNTSTPANFSGNRLAHVPKVSANLGADYTLKLGDRLGALKFSANGYYSGSYFLSAQNSSRVEQSSFATFNARASWLSSDSHWDVSAWGNNLTSRELYSQAEITALGIIAQFAPLRTFGADVLYKW